MKIIIKATAPTTYQHKSLTLFNMDIKKHGNGSFTSMQEFDSVEDAKKYLTKRAELLFSDGRIWEKEYNEAIADIKNGFMTLDGVTASIDEIEEDED